MSHNGGHGSDESGKGGAELVTAYPPIDLFERNETLILRALVPGVPRERIEVAVDDHSVTIRGSLPEAEITGTLLHSERGSGRFSRTVPLPTPVDSRRIHAHLENGVLELTLPKLVEGGVQHLKVH